MHLVSRFVCFFAVCCSLTRSNINLGKVLDNRTAKLPTSKLDVLQKKTWQNVFKGVLGLILKSVIDVSLKPSSLITNLCCQL